MNKVILRILIILSIVIILSGILLSINTRGEIKDKSMPTQNIYMDGTDVTSTTEAFVEIGSGLLGIIIVIYSIFVVACMRGVYGVIFLVIVIIKKIKQKNEKLRKNLLLQK